MRFYNYLHEDMDTVLQQGLNNLQSLEINEEIVEVNEETKQQLNEAAISVTLIVSVILALPSLLSSIAKSIGFIFGKIKKLFGGEDKSTAAEKVINFAEKWHHAYVKTLRQILRMGGVFKSAGITDKEKQMKATEVVFYTIIFGFAVHGGVTTGKSLIKMAKSATLTKLNITTLEGIVTAIKSKEVTQFIKGIMRA